MPEHRQRFNPSTVQRNMEAAQHIIEGITYVTIDPQFTGWRLVRDLLAEAVADIDGQLEAALKDLEV